MYVNPAFAGGSHEARATIHQRIQWPKLDAKYITSLMYVDKYFGKYNSGVGILVMHDRQGSNTISSTDIAIQYAYELHLDKKYAIRFGLQGGMFSRYINYANLTYPHNFQGFNSDGTPDLNGAGAGDQRKNIIDVTAGALFYANNLWVGLSVGHINQPDQSFLGTEVTQLPRKYTLMGGYKINLGNTKEYLFHEHEKEISISPTINYKSQGRSDQLDLGLYGIYDHLIYGVWYRGIPFKKFEADLQNNESMVLIAGWKLPKSFEIRYSYDFTVSKLKEARTGGSHEINLTVLLHRPYKGKKPVKRLPCPTHHVNTF